MIISVKQLPKQQKHRFSTELEQDGVAKDRPKRVGEGPQTPSAWPTTAPNNKKVALAAVTAPFAKRTKNADIAPIGNRDTKNACTAKALFKPRG